MSALSAASTLSHSAGDLTLKIFKFSSVGDGDTFASGLSTSVVAYVAQNTSDPTTNTSAGVNVGESSGTFTFYPGIASTAVTLFVWVSGA